MNDHGRLGDFRSLQVSTYYGKQLEDLAQKGANKRITITCRNGKRGINEYIRRGSGEPNQQRFSVSGRLFLIPTCNQ